MDNNDTLCIIHMIYFCPNCVNFLPENFHFFIFFEGATALLRPLQARATFFHGGGYHIETSPLSCTANQWTGFYMIGISVMKELSVSFPLIGKPLINH